MSFIQKSKPPPDVKEGQVLEATVTDVEYPIEGKYGKQIRFRLELSNGYKFNSWIKYYDEPSDRSRLGKLAITYMDLVQGPFEKVGEVLEGLKKHGRVYVSCSGFREFEEQLYPKFKVVVDRLPGMQTEITKQPTQAPLSQLDLDRLSPELRAKVLAELNK